MSVLTFNNIHLSAINRNNQIWLSSSELAKALQYSHCRSISKIYTQHADEFTSHMTRITESVTSTNLKVSTRIFSLRGCHLIAMFSRTEVAKDFRRWVLDILDKEVESKNVTINISSMDSLTLNQLTSDELCHFAWLCKASEQMRTELEELEPAFRILKSERATRIYTMYSEYRSVIRFCKKTVQEKMNTITIDRNDMNWQRILPFIQ